MSACRICTSDGSTDWTSDNISLGELFGTTESSIRRWREKHAEHGEVIESAWRPLKRWGKPGDWRYSEETSTEVHLDNARIDSLIRDWPFTPLQGFAVDDDLANPADPQIGKAGEAGGGTDETIARFNASIEEVAHRWELLKPKNGYLCDLGDIVENLFSTPQQQSTNDRTLPEQVEDAVAMYMNALGRLLPLVGTLHHATVTSNHGEARSAPKVNPYGSENDWGLSIQRQIKGKCGDRGWPVVFHRPDKNEDTTVLTMTDGTEVALNHGHHSGSPKGMKQWVTGQIVGRRPGWNARVWIHGHYHHDEHFPVGNGVTVFGTPALDGGSAWFTRKTGESSPPGIMCLTMRNGKWLNHSIL